MNNVSKIPNSKVLDEKLTARWAFTTDAIALVLAQEYPNLTFSLAEQTSISRDGGVVDGALRRIADHREMWLRNLVGAAGGNPVAAWLGVGKRGYLATRWEGASFVFCAPFGSGPYDFFQITVVVGAEQTVGALVEDNAPADLDDLLHPLDIAQKTSRQVSPVQVLSVSVDNVAQFFRGKETTEFKRRMEELPELRKKTMTVVECCSETGASQKVDVPLVAMFPGYASNPSIHARWGQDWAESSAGRSGQVLCRRWYFSLTRRTDVQGRVEYGWCVPIPVMDERLSQEPLKVVDGTPPAVMLEALTQFDLAAGYPFAWYFHMVHGGRISPLAGEIVVEGLRHGVIALPHEDAEVLLRWADCPYGF